MDWRVAFDLTFTLAAFFGGWMLRMIFVSVRDLKDADSELHERIDHIIGDLPGTYMRRDDFRAFSDEIRQTLARIEGKLDKKVDR